MRFEKTANPVGGLVALALMCGHFDASGQDGKGAENLGPVGIAQREAARRQQQVQSTKELLTTAEFDRREGNFEEAIDKYQTAFRALPVVPAARELRSAVFDRYQRASVEYAQVLIDQAEWQKAEDVLNAVMIDARDGGLPAGKIQPELKTLLGQLKSDDRFNKAMTPGHLKNVKNVEDLLSKANGYVEIGDFDAARKTYHVVLTIDRYNQAARRGLEEVERSVMDYEKVAFNHTRSSMLEKIAAGWAIQPPPTAAGVGAATEDIDAGLGTRQATIENKLKSIIIPQVEFQATPLSTVIEYLTQLSQDLDVTELNPENRGLNIVIDNSLSAAGDSPGEKTLNLRLTNAPLGTILRYATQQIGMKYRVDPFAVTIIPQTASSTGGLMTRGYSVPPGFISGGSGGGGESSGPTDPFAAPAATGGGTLIKKVTAREFLEERGVTFPEGATANFNPVNSSLVVRNNSQNITLIESLIISARESSGKQVRVDFKLISTTQNDLKQLGFEWMLGQFNMNGANSVFGSGGTYGNAAPPADPLDFPFVGPNQNIIGQTPLTGGLRHAAPDLSSLDAVLLQEAGGSAALSSKAPGVFGVAGAFTDPQFQVVLRTLNQTSGVDLLSSSSVTVNPGETATLSDIREFIYPTSYDPPEIPTTIGMPPFGNDGGVAAPIAPANPTDFEMRGIGKLLEVTPTIGASDYAVTINIKIDMTEFLGFINYGSPINMASTNNLVVATQENDILMPVFESIQHDNIVTIYDGSTLVIGGLIGETIQHIHDKTPFLGDAPVIGRLFRSDIKVSAKTALMLFATVRVLDPSGKPLHQLSDPAFAGGDTAAQAN